MGFIDSVQWLRPFVPLLVLGYFLLLSIVKRRVPLTWYQHMKEVPFLMFFLAAVHVYTMDAAWMRTSTAGMLSVVVIDLMVQCVMFAVGLGTLGSAWSQRLEYGWPDLVHKLGIALAAFIAFLTMF